MPSEKIKTLKNAANKLKSRAESRADKLLASIHNRLESILSDLNKYEQMRKEMGPEISALSHARDKGYI